MDKVGLLAELVRKRKLGSFLFTNFYSIFYLSRFKGVSETERESYLLYADGGLHLFAPRLYQAEAKSLECESLKVHIVPERNEFYPTLATALSGSGGESVGFEAEDLKFGEYEDIRTLFNKKLVPVLGLVSEMRIVKAEEEIVLIKKAQMITYEAFEKVLPMISPSKTEKELASKLKSEMEELGAESDSFSAIVASGEGSALPHYLTSNRKIKKGEMVLFDFGAKYKGYCGDTTRMVFLGKPTDRMVKIYDLVRKSQEDSVKAIKQGIVAKGVFKAANDVFVNEGVEANFTHGLGHGIGLAVHEAPYIRRTSDEVLREGMVFSVEPGLYFEGWGGVRIEDLVVVRKDSAEVLGNFTKDIVII